VYRSRHPLAMERMEIRVISVRLVDGEVQARVIANNPRTRIRIELTFPARQGANPWEAAYDEALRFLDVA
jgi:hypothetical protein